MLGTGLAPEEVAKRLVRLNNLERLHGAQKKRIKLLEEQVRLLKRENKVLRDENRTLRSSMDDLKLQMEELRTIVFGKKRKKEATRDDDFPPSPIVSCEPRPKESYRRKPPADDEITDTHHHSIDRCSHCNGPIGERETTTYFEEDIPLPPRKIVVRHTIEKGYCEACHRWSAAIPLPPAPVILGRNVQRYVCYLHVVCRQPYSAIENILHHSYGFAISQGEIAKILEREANRLRPAFQQLQARIRGEPSIHLDETGWNILIGGDRGFAWTMAGGTSKDAVFLLGTTRGKGNAEALIGDSHAVVVSDDYRAYWSLENPHQLCCAHILRKLRDLATSGEIADATKARCRSAYGTFAAIYADIEAARTSPDAMTYHDALLGRLHAFATPNAKDPAKLARVRTQIRERGGRYLTCLKFSGVASDNNAAERSLRHLVLKRKISFGSFSEKTAETLAILSSVLLSWKRRGELRGYLMGV